MKLIALTLTALPFISGCSALAELDARIQGRSMAQPIAPVETITPTVFDPMKQMVRLEFPPKTETVEQGVNHLIAGSSIQLVTRCPVCPPEAPTIAADPISPLAYARPGEITTVERGMLLVLGSDAGLVVDLPNNLVTFEYIQPEETF